MNHAGQGRTTQGEVFFSLFSNACCQRLKNFGHMDAERKTARAMASAFQNAKAPNGLRVLSAAHHASVVWEQAIEQPRTKREKAITRRLVK